MHLQWRGDKFRSLAARMLTELDQKLKVNPNGSVTVGWNSELDYGAHVLAAACTLSGELREHQRVKIARQAIVAVKKRGALSLEAVRRAIQSGQREYFRQPERSFVLLSSWSVPSTYQLPRSRVLGSTLSFASWPPRRFKLPAIANRRRRTGAGSPFGFTSVRTSVRARDTNTAGDEALDRMDFLRGLWNLALNYGTRRIAFGGNPGPVNKIVLGPLHTLHSSNGAPIEGIYWSETIPDQRPSGRLSAADVAHMKSFEKWARALLVRSRLCDELVDYVRSYCRALDERVTSTSYVRLWSLLEDLTAIAPGNYDQLVKRTRFLPNDPAYVGLILEQLRTWRNRIVHDSDDPVNLDLFVNDLRWYVELLVIFLLDHPRDFHSMEEFGSFLSLPRSRNELRTSLNLHKLAMAIRG